MITDKQRLDFLEFMFDGNHKGNALGGCLNIDRDEGSVFWADSTCTKEDSERSREFKNTPIHMFTVRTQHVRGKSIRELIDRAILSKPVLGSDGYFKNSK